MMIKSGQLRREFERLLASDDPVARGPAFEKLLHAQLARDGFVVHLGPKSAKPRQTDLIAILGSQHFLIEAKWRQRKVDVADIDGLRDRLRRVPADFVGCIFNMSDFAAPAIEEVERDRTREILLFNPAEINAIFGGRLTAQELIRRKREALRVDAKVLFVDSKPNSPTAIGNFPNPRRQFRTGGTSVPLVSFPTDSHDTTFLLETPDTGATDTFVSTTLRLDISNATELAEVLELIQNTIGLSEDGCFSIQQLSHAWHGFGAKNFLEAIENWEQRYADAKLKSPHHSEDLTYLDLSNGALIGLSSRQRIGNSSFCMPPSWRFRWPVFLLIYLTCKSLQNGPEIPMPSSKPTLAAACMSSIFATAKWGWCRYTRS
jgi:hypothetical protein